MAAADAAFATWRNTPAEKRAAILIKAAEIARKRDVALSAVQVLEVGKQWGQAFNDVGEAIDFLEYYAREAVRLGTPRNLGKVPGEVNQLFYEPRGICAVIAPWNFPLAISCGMAAGALAAGNCVIYKPSRLSSLIGFDLPASSRKPPARRGCSTTAGPGSVMGDYLVTQSQGHHHRLHRFHGSGTAHPRQGGDRQPGQVHCKRWCRNGRKTPSSSTTTPTSTKP